MPALEATLVFAGVPLALYLVIYVLTVLIRRPRRPRYRMGQPWHYPGQWWTASAEDAGLEPLGAASTDGRAGSAAPSKVGGGASGSW